MKIPRVGVGRKQILGKDQLKSSEIDDNWLGEIERRHNLFPNIDYRIYA